VRPTAVGAGSGGGGAVRGGPGRSDWVVSEDTQSGGEEGGV